MGQVIDFETYKNTGKIEEVTIVTVRQGDVVDVELPDGWAMFSEDIGFPNYRYYLIDEQKHRNCAHIEIWRIKEKNYSARCERCGLSAWAAPW